MRMYSPAQYTVRCPYHHMRLMRFAHPGVLTGLALAALLALTLAPYKGNVTALFHLDNLMANDQPVPLGFVILDVPAYDGAHYYQIARNIPQMLQPARWDHLRSLPTLSYAYQRLLLPLSAFILSFGQEAAMPYTFLLINVAAIIAACAIVWRNTKSYIYSFAIAFCPSAMVALHFSLAEPLTLLILTVFLIRFRGNNEQLAWLDVLLLSLLTWSREVNILFVGLLFAYLLYRMNWKNAAMMLIPIAAFAALHGWIYLMFGNFPFLTSAGNRTFPFGAIFDLVTGAYGYNRLTITSIPLALFFTTPVLLWSGWLIAKNKDRSFLAIGTFMFALLMTMMSENIWGSITSIGRVITPVYPLTILLAAKHGTLFSKYINTVILLIGIGAAIALALSIHPYHLA